MSPDPLLDPRFADPRYTEPLSAGTIPIDNAPVYTPALQAPRTNPYLEAIANSLTDLPRPGRGFGANLAYGFATGLGSGLSSGIERRKALQQIFNEQARYQNQRTVEEYRSGLEEQRQARMARLNASLRPTPTTRALNPFERWNQMSGEERKAYLDFKSQEAAATRAPPHGRVAGTPGTTVAIPPNAMSPNAGVTDTLRVPASSRAGQAYLRYGTLRPDTLAGRQPHWSASAARLEAKAIGLALRQTSRRDAMGVRGLLSRIQNLPEEFRNDPAIAEGRKRMRR